jgi:predicted Zn-dependent peptidase
VALGVLSGGMFGRLFIEVREKRGLVYNVSASHQATRGRAAVFASASTTPANAEQTMSVMLEQLRSIEQGVSDEELSRSKANIATRLVMQGESSSGRAAALATDWWNLGKVRTLGEIKSHIDAVTSAHIIEAVKRFPPEPLTVVTLGSKKLSMPFVKNIKE